MLPPLRFTPLKAVEALEVASVAGLEGERSDRAAAFRTLPVTGEAWLLSRGGSGRAGKVSWRRCFGRQISVVWNRWRLRSSCELVWGCSRGVRISKTTLFILHKTIATGQTSLTARLKWQLGDGAAALATRPISLIHRSQV